MSTKENIKLDFLKLFNGHTADEAVDDLTNSINKITRKYGDEEAVLDILNSIDVKGEGLLSFQVAVDPQYHVTVALAGSRDALSFDGKDYLKANRG